MSMTIILGDGTRVEVPYMPELMAFEHEGARIRDPLMSPCGQKWVPATTYGFEEYHTGGGCMAYRKVLPGGRYLLLTDEGGCDIPETREEADEAVLGLYSEAGDELACVILRDIPL